VRTRTALFASIQLFLSCYLVMQDFQCKIDCALLFCVRRIKGENG